MKRLLLPLLICAGIAGTVARAQTLPVARQPGATAPDFETRDLSGKTIKLSDFRDKVVVIDFWATWCNPCMQAMPHTQELAAMYKSKGVVVLAVCTGDKRRKFEDWVNKNQEKYPDIVFTADVHDSDSATFEERASSKHYTVPGIPAQFVVGRDGKIAGTMIGYEKDDVRVEYALARAGVAVDAAKVAAGEAQVKKAAMEDEEKRRIAANAPPPPTFYPRFGLRKSGEALPDFTLIGADGSEMKFSSLRGKAVVLVLGFRGSMASLLQSIHEKYGPSGVVTLGLFAYSKREDYDAWVKENAGKYGFVTAWDPAGEMARAEGQKPNMEELAAYDAKTIMRALFGGEFRNGTSSIPASIVIDPQGNLMGTFFPFSKSPTEGVGNLLLRAGIKLPPAAMPEKVASPDDFVIKAPPPAEAKKQMLTVGAIAPDFVTKDLIGNEVRLSDFKGKVVILDFWATWCGPCIASMPHTQSVAQHYKDQGVVVLGSCTSDSRQNFDKWVMQNQAKYPDFVFSHDSAEKTPNRASYAKYGVTGIPTQFIIDRQGRIAAIQIGYIEGEVLLDAALSKAGVNVAPEILAKAVEDQKARDSRS